MASIVKLFIGELVGTVSIGGDSTGVVEEVENFGSLARELVGELLCQISFADFFFSSKFKDIINLTSCFTLISPVVGFKTLIPLEARPPGSTLGE